MDVSANIGVVISGTRYESPIPAPLPPAASAFKDSVAATPAGEPVSDAFTDAPSPAPGAIAAAVKLLPANIRYAPSHPPRDVSAAPFDKRA